MRWGQQFRFFRDEVIATMTPVTNTDLEDEEQPEETGRDET
jgi:hypothetical protein